MGFIGDIVDTISVINDAIVTTSMSSNTTAKYLFAAAHTELQLHIVQFVNDNGHAIGIHHLDGFELIQVSNKTNGTDFF